MNELGQLFQKHGTDKCSKHKYHEVYEPLFSKKRNEEINFLEIGIWNGNSMAAFLEYFPNGTVYGLDIFTRMQPHDVPALAHPRAVWAMADTTKAETIGVLSNKFSVKFDYILDDGAHNPEANMLTFRHCSPFLKRGGVYIIEDVWPLDIMTSEEMKHPWILQHPGKYNNLKFDSFMKVLEVSGMELERFDQRRVSRQPDSYSMVLRKK